MKLAQWIGTLRDNLKLLRNVMIAYLAVLVILDFFISREHAHYLIDKIYSYWALFGIVGCFVLIKFSKGIAHLFLAKDEDYYERS